MLRGMCLTILGSLAIGAFGANSAVAGELTRGLADELALHGSRDLVSVSIQMRDVPDYASLDAQATQTRLHRKDRQSFVVREMRAQADLLDEGMRSQLNALQASGEASDVRDLWMAGGFSLRATPGAIRLLAARADVYLIGSNPEVNMLDAIMPVPGGGPATPASNPQPGVRSNAWSIDYINAPAVWATGFNGTGVLVAEIDTGIWYTHTDLASRIWANDDPWDGVDNDGNGYIDDFHGYNFYSHTRDPLDDHNHGTHVAGSVCGNGTAGTQTGVAPGAHIMACKILNSGGSGVPSALVEGVQYAIANGADIITGSIGWWQPDAATRQMYRNVCESARVAGVTMTIATGNERGYSPPPGGVPRTPGDVPPPWRHPDQPANGSIGGVISIGATGYRTDTYAYFSSNGPSKWNTISPWNDYGTSPYLIRPDVCAPGENINSTMRGGGYSGDTWSGTSMATPHVAGAVALMLSKNPELLPAQVDSIMENTCLPLGAAGKDNDYGSGRIRCPELVAAVPSPNSPPVAAFSGDPLYGDAPLSVQFTDHSSNAPTSWAWDFGDGSAIETTQNPLHVYTSPGSYTVTLTATNSFGSDSEVKTNYITAYPPGTANIHVSAMAIQRGKVSAGSWGAKCQVTIVDETGAPVSGATVSGVFNAPSGTTRTGVTNASGVAVVKSATTTTPPADWCMDVTDVTKPGETYDPTQSVVTHRCESGDVTARGASLALSRRGSEGVSVSSADRQGEIAFSLPEAGHVTLRIFDVSGRMVSTLVERSLEAGNHSYSWNGNGAASGVFFYHLQAGDEVHTGKMVLMAP